MRGVVSRSAMAAVGIWLMAAPAVLGYAGAAADSQRVVGPVASALAVVAMWEATRGVQWGILPAGVWLIVSPLVIHHPLPAAITSLAAGVLLAGLTPVRGPRRHRLGGGWAALLPGRRPE